VLLAGPPGTTGHLDADLRDTATLINRATAMLDFTRPVAILLISVLGHLGQPGEGEREGARLAAAMLREALPPGGFLVVADLAAHPELDKAMGHYASTGAAPYHVRPPKDIGGFLNGLEITAPGVVPVTRWRPEPDPAPVPGVPAWGGVGRKVQPHPAAGSPGGEGHARVRQTAEHSQDHQSHPVARPRRRGADARR
jgi:hypothetical protein